MAASLTLLAYFGQTNIARLNPAKTALDEIMTAHPEHSHGMARAISAKTSRGLA